MLSRRSFLKWAGGAAAAAAVAKAIPHLPALELDPDKALWVPGAKSIFIPGSQTIRPLSAHETLLYDAEALAKLAPAAHMYDATLGVRITRYMLNEQGLIVPVTPEGYRAGYQIYDTLSDIIAPNLNVNVKANAPWMWKEGTR